MSKQDRQGVRTPAEVERRWNFKKKFGDAMEAAAEASDKVDALDGKMDQTEIFNRLTNNGKAQGLYRDEEGNLYINASYLATGVLKSADGTTFYLDLVNGILRGRFEEFTISGKTVGEIVNEASEEAQTNAKKYADEAVEKAVEAQTQEYIFNRLTNNGASKGIFYFGGQLYINASYLSAGVLKSADDSTFYLDLENNTLKILGKTVSWEQGDDGKYYLVGK